MKALIVDDEKHVREGLALLAEWEKYGITSILEASDGEEAIKLIKQYEPEIIFTDMHMPKCDGIELIKWLHISGVPSKTIVVSGYDDFRYLKNAIKFGTFDYLLKPIHKQELDETLGRAVEKWNEQHAVRQTKLANEQVVWDHLLSSSLEHSQLGVHVREDIQKVFHIDIAKVAFRFAIMPIRKVTQRKYRGDANTTFVSLLKICNKVLKKHKAGIAFRNRNRREGITFFLWNDENDAIFTEMIEAIHRETGLYCCVNIGQPSHQLNEAYESARIVTNSLNLLDEKQGVTIRSKFPATNKQIPNLFDYSAEIKWGVQSGSFDQLDEVLGKIFSKMEQTNQLTIEQVELWETQFDLLKEHWLKEYQIDKHISLYQGQNYWNEKGLFSFEQFKAEKRKEFHDLLELIYDVEYKKEKNSVQQIEEYLRMNYQKDVSLSEIADRFYLSREYISRRFKQEFQETMTDYVSKIRIEKAKELLANPYLKVYEIANTVGYQNDKYFIKVFKKFEGVTPSEYRSSLPTEVK